VWLIAGCAGCSLLAVVALVALGALTVSTVTSSFREVGPVTTESVQQQLGPDVPRYPGSALEPVMTRTIAGSLKLTGKLARPFGGDALERMFQGVGAFTTPDTPEKILAFYDAELKKHGWNPTRSQEGSERVYRKGNSALMIDVGPNTSGPGNIIVMMRGGPELLDGTAPASPPAPGSQP
jgi:hypothetical protein